MHAAATADNPLDVFFDLVPTGAALYAPVLDEQGDVVDFRFVRLNPAGQRLLGLPAQPPRTFREYYPNSVPSGIFGQYRAAYLTGQATTYDVPYQGDGIDTFFRLVAQRSGDLLVVNFTDMADLPRSAVEQALRTSQAREAAARAEAERQRLQLYHVLEQAPAMICVFDGPQHIFEFVNPSYQALVGERPLIGKPIAEAMPELVGQPIFALLDGVYQTGETFYANEMLVQLDHLNEGRQELDKHYYNFIYQARYSQAGAVDGIFVFAYDVTAQVEARQQVQHLNERLATTNKELQAANEELQTNNQELLLVQLGLQQLTQELETRVQERTQQATQQTARLNRLIQEAPAAIALLDGPTLMFELLNADYQALFPDRELLGKPVLEAIPELTSTPLADVLQSVYRTGITFEGEEFLIPFTGNDGRPYNRYFDFIYQARYDAADTIDGVVVFGFDVTERVQRRQQTEALQAEVLAATQRRVAARENVYQIFAQAPAAIALLREPDHQLAYVNPAFKHLFPAENMLGRTVAEVYPDALGRGVISRLDGVFQTGETYVGTEVPLPVAPSPEHPDQPRYFNFTYQAYREEGRIAGVAVFVYEVTEQVLTRQRLQQLHEELATTNEELLAANEELAVANAQLTRVNTDLDNFTYTASHDLKAPITNIEGLLTALREELTLPADEADTEAVLHMMEDSVKRFQRTLKYLTDVTRLHAPEQLPVASVSLASLVADIRLDLQPLLTVSGGQVTVDPDGCDLVTFAEKHLRSILHNLISNALKYRHPDRAPRVQVRCHLLSRAVALEVQDNGLGLTEPQQARVFGMFQRLHDHVEGTGIGLYLVKQVVDAAGGRISVESQPGVGSLFRVVLPQPSATLPAEKL